MFNRAPSHRVWSFDAFCLDTDRGTIAQHGRELKLRPQSFDVLSHLVRHHGVLVSKQELMDAVWGNKAVTDDSLTHCLIDIRRVLGDDSHELIRTIPRRGFIFEADVVAPVVARPSRRAEDKRWRLVAAIALIIGAAAVALTVMDDRQLPSGVPAPLVAPTPNSIAVLPFDDMTDEQDQLHFAHGMSAEIINLLSQIDGLQVIARTSSFSFENGNMDAGEFAKRLNVSHILEGSVRKTESQIRVTAQLINSSDMMHIWSGTFDRQIDDTLKVQLEIAAAVARALQSTLVASDPVPGISPAYDLYLQGKFIYNRRGPGDVGRSREYFLQAVAVDPAFAPAWAGLAGAYHSQIYNDELDPDTALSKLREAAETAVALDPNNAEGKLRLSNAYALSGERERAFDLFEQVVADHPNDPLALSMAAGQAGWGGDMEKAIELNRKSVLLDPLNTVNIGNQAGFLAAAGRFDEAIAMNRKLLMLNPGSLEETEQSYAQLLILKGEFEEALAIILECPQSLARSQGLALVYAALGKTAKANEAMQILEESDDPRAEILIAEIHAHQGKTDASFRQLQRLYSTFDKSDSFVDFSEYQVAVRFSPLLRSLHDDQRWTALLADSR